MFDNYPDVVTANELAHMLHIGKNKTYELLQKHKILHIRVGKKYLIPKKNIIAYLETHSCSCRENLDAIK